VEGRRRRRSGSGRVGRRVAMGATCGGTERGDVDASARQVVQVARERRFRDAGILGRSLPAGDAAQVRSFVVAVASVHGARTRDGHLACILHAALALGD